MKFKYKKLKTKGAKMEVKPISLTKGQQEMLQQFAAEAAAVDKNRGIMFKTILECNGVPEGTPFRLSPDGTTLIPLSKEEFERMRNKINDPPRPQALPFPSPASKALDNDMAQTPIPELEPVLAEANQ